MKLISSSYDVPVASYTQWRCGRRGGGGGGGAGAIAPLAALNTGAPKYSYRAPK